MSTTAQADGVEATLTDTELIARGTSKVRHFALVGPGGPAELKLPLEQIERASHSRPKGFGALNGRLDVYSVDGKRYQFHYRVKKQADFADFAEKVVAAVEGR
jgi:membrane-bound lytic murein transglycosylase MltF